MAKKLKPGDVINGYRIVKCFGPGSCAVAYQAQAPNGDPVFLKQYKSPSATVPWYRPYMKYQHELTRRLRAGPTMGFCLPLRAHFQATWGGPTYFQVFDLITRGTDLRGMLERERDAARGGLVPPFPAESWHRRVLWAKVLVSALNVLHDARIAHTDLKPENVYLIEDATIHAGYQLRLVDMDFSLLTDVEAPWKGHQGYFGSPNYFSPEHLRGETPGAASDVFTCGLILYEVLAGFHPYWSETGEEYAGKVARYRASPPQLGGSVPEPALTEEVAALLHRCLEPKARDRPAARDLRDALTGRTPAARKAQDAGAAGVARGSVPARPPLSSGRIRLVAASGHAIEIGVRTDIGKYLCRQLGDDAEFWDAVQLTLERDDEGHWRLRPAADTPNETLLNGRRVSDVVTLAEGDVIAVGRAARGVAKLPLRVEAGR